MNLAEVMEEAAAVLRVISGLEVFAYPPHTLTPPAGYVSYPSTIVYDAAYQRGEDNFVDLPFVLLSSPVTEVTARDTVARWARGSGEGSIKAAMEAHAWTTCDDLTVNSCEFDVEQVGTVGYLAAMFKATVVGPGGE